MAIRRRARATKTCVPVCFFASGKSRVSICWREGKKNIVDSLQKGKLNCEDVGKWAGRDEQSSNIWKEYVYVLLYGKFESYIFIELFY